MAPFGASSVQETPSRIPQAHHVHFGSRGPRVGPARVLGRLPRHAEATTSAAGLGVQMRGRGVGAAQRAQPRNARRRSPPGVSCDLRWASGSTSGERGDATPPQRRTTVPPAGGRSCALGCAGAALGRVPPTTRACGHRGCVLLPSGGLGRAYSTPAGTGGGVFPKWDAHRTTSDHFGLTGVLHRVAARRAVGRAAVRWGWGNPS